MDNVLLLFYYLNTVPGRCLFFVARWTNRRPVKKTSYWINRNPAAGSQLHAAAGGLGSFWSQLTSLSLLARIKYLWLYLFAVGFQRLFRDTLRERFKKQTYELPDNHYTIY